VNNKGKPKSAFQLPEVRVVEASAGSGKTYALAKRYIQLLLNPALEFEHIAIRNILALTFTNKASFEMKSRILEFLKQIALGGLPKGELEEIIAPLSVTSEQAQKKAYTIMESIIHNYNFFQVQTIDKFINALLSGCAFKIGLTANFKIKTNSREYLEHSLDQLIDSANEDAQVAKIFETFLHHYLYLENRSGWFPKDDILSIVAALFGQHNTYGYDFKESPFKSTDLGKNKKLILENIKSLREILPEQTDKRFINALDNFLSKHTNGFDIDNVSDYFAREDVPVRKNTKVDKKLEKLWAKIHSDLIYLCEQEAYSLFNPYIDIFTRVKQGFYELSAREDVLFLEELNKRAGMLFDDDYVTVEELYYRLATRFHHYLIDEFQDTSSLQWHNLQKMVEEALSTGGSLFYVGDRKQAIYGFRGGDVALFDNIKDDFNAFNVQIEPLTKNWRSQKAIVDFNNAVFSAENLEKFIDKKQDYESQKKKKNAVVFADSERAEVKRIFQESTQSYRPENTNGYVHVEFVDAKIKDDRDELIRARVIEQVKQLKKRFSYRDIAILTRSNFEVEKVTNWLLEEGVLIESERTSNVKENCIIEEIVSFLKFLDSPIDNLAFTEFILGDAFAQAAGLSKEELQSFVFGLRDRLHKEKDFYVYSAFRDEYPEIWSKYIDEFFRNVGLFPLYELLVSIYSRLNCLENFAQYQGFLMHFLELVKKQEEEHADIRAFLEYYDNLLGEDLYVRVTDAQAIKILTIHKSKGLEFPVVILPFLGMDIQVGSSQPDNQQSYILQEVDGEIELLRLKNKYFNFSESLFEIHKREYKKAFLSELNNVYVALTRPQNELYIFVSQRVGNSFNFAQLLIPEGFYEQGQQIEYTKTKQKDKNIHKLPSCRYHDWIDYLKDEFLDQKQIVNRQQRLRGEILHFLLAFVGNFNEQKQTDVLQSAQSQAELRFSNVKDFTESINIVKHLIEHEDLKPFFYVDQAEIYNEREVVNSFGHTKRIDRLIVKDKEVWIVDYKSSLDAQDEYEDQVKEYMDIIKSLYKGKKIRGFLINMEEQKMKEVRGA